MEARDIIRASALSTLFFNGGGNLFLNIVFFYITVGTVMSFLGTTVGFIAGLSISVIFGVGFLSYEIMVHARSALNRTWKDAGAYWLIVVILVAVNQGGGFVRVENTNRQLQAEAAKAVANDPEYKSIIDQINFYNENMLDDGYVANDEITMNRIDSLRKAKTQYVETFKKDASVFSHNYALITVAVVAFFLVSLSFGDALKTYIVTTSKDLSPLRRLARIKSGWSEYDATADVGDPLLSEAAHIKSKSGRKAWMIAYILKYKQGATIVGMAEALAVSQQTIRNYLKQILQENSGNQELSKFVNNIQKPSK